MTPFEEDFVIPPQIVTQVGVRGIGGSRPATKRGTVRWSIFDDQGRRHNLFIHGVYLVPDLPYRLLSPQHFAQVMQEHETTNYGTSSTTYRDRVTLTWNDRRYSLTTPLNSANVGVTFLAPSITNIQRKHLRPDDESITALPSAIEGADTTVRESTTTKDQNPTDHSIANLAHRLFCGECPTDQEIITESMACDNAILSANVTPVQELLIWHYRFGHRSFKHLQRMAQQGLLPARLAQCRYPVCTSCRFGKATRVPWTDKQSPGSLKTATRPGQCVSVDQVQSSVPGLVGHMKGIPTTKRFS